MNKTFFTVIILTVFTSTFAQPIKSIADSIRTKYNIPELAYAVVSADSVYEMEVLGFQRINTNYKAKPEDKFRIGSNTKAITGFIAAQMVMAGKITWDTKFFDLFPELKPASNRVHYNLTLQHLLSFRTRLFPYTYTYNEPTIDQFSGTEEEQRYQFTKWFFQQKPVADDADYHFSNLGYTAAALMLEKVSGKSYKTLVNDLGKQLNIDFSFGNPNSADTLQPWGHNQDLIPEAPIINYKLNWLLAAGNINVSLPDYLKFVQTQLQGLYGKSPLMPAGVFKFLHFGLERFSIGWFWATDEKGEVYSYNIGNPGTFLSKVYVFPKSNKAYIFLTNVQSPGADAGIDQLYNELKKRYAK